MEKVIAVVVSYNHQTELEQCIYALRAQSYPLDGILVVNNGSTDYTSVWLDQQDDIIHLYQDNLGKAGGFNTGISWAYQNGFDWIWCMEGDGYPKEDALEIMLKKEGIDLALMSSLILDKNDKTSLVSSFKNYVFKQKTTKFNFLKVKKNIVEAIIAIISSSL